jgi:hypothetical protein
MQTAMLVAKLARHVDAEVVEARTGAQCTSAIAPSGPALLARS